MSRTDAFRVSRWVVVALVAAMTLSLAGCRGRTPHSTAVSRFYYICDVGSASEVEAMLRADPGLVRARDAAKGTPLHCAAMRGDVQVIDVLVRHGADVNALDLSNDTPLSLAVWGGKREAVRHLISAHANVNIFSRGYNAPLHAAVARNDLETVKLLVEAGADVNATADPSHMLTPLFIADGNKAISRYLVSRGAKR